MTGVLIAVLCVAASHYVAFVVFAVLALVYFHRTAVAVEGVIKCQVESAILPSPCSPGSPSAGASSPGDSTPPPSV